MRQALIDGDVIVYEIASCGEYEEQDEYGVVIKHIRDFEFVRELADERIKGICLDASADEPPILFFTGNVYRLALLNRSRKAAGEGEVIPQPSLRAGIATVKPYKGARKEEKPYHFNNLTAYLFANYEYCVSNGLEADDELSIYQTEVMKEFGVRMGRLLLDYEDWLKYSNYSYKINDSGYYIRSVGDEDFRLHREIMGNPDEFVDHANGDKDDNRKYNLRVCTNKENVRNSKSRAGSSIYKGVHWDSERNKWGTTIMVDGVSKGLGRYDDEIEAAKAYDDAAKKYFGKFARLNLEQPYTKPFKETIICTRDKDLRMVPGLHFSWECGAQPSFGPELVDPKGWLRTDAGGKVRGVGLKFFFYQMLVGDTVDNIPGCPKVGPVKALAILEACNTRREHELAIIECYKKVYPENYEDMLIEQSKLLWMVRELNEDGTPVDYDWKF